MPEVGIVNVCGNVDADGDADADADAADADADADADGNADGDADADADADRDADADGDADGPPGSREGLQRQWRTRGSVGRIDFGKALDQSNVRRRWVMRLKRLESRRSSSSAMVVLPPVE
jgi:hypothetical protein